MGNRKRSLPLARHLEALRPVDRVVLLYLNQLREEDNTCTKSLPAIAAACDISERQAQISAGRLIEAGLLERVGYDFGNVVRLRRGTKYRLLVDQDDLHQILNTEDIKRAVHTLISQQQAIDSRLTKLTLVLNMMHSQKAGMAAQPVSIQEIKGLIELLSSEECRELTSWLQQRLRRGPKLKRHPVATLLSQR